MEYSAKNLREMSESDLQQLLAQYRGELRQMRFLISQGEHSEMHKVQQAKKAIARILTVLNEKKTQGLTEESKQA